MHWAVCALAFAASLEKFAINLCCERPTVFRCAENQKGLTVMTADTILFVLMMPDIGFYTKAPNFESASGKIQVTAASTDFLSAKASSGAVSCNLETVPSKCKIRAVSGKVTVNLPENSDFTANVNTTSGSFESDFALKKTVTPIYAAMAVPILISKQLRVILIFGRNKRFEKKQAQNVGKNPFHREE